MPIDTPPKPRASQSAKNTASAEAPDELQSLSAGSWPKLVAGLLAVLLLAVLLLMLFTGNERAPEAVGTGADERQPGAQAPAPEPTNTPETPLVAPPQTFTTYETTCGSVPYTKVYSAATALEPTEREAFACFLTALDSCSSASFAIAGTNERPGSRYAIQPGTPDACSVTQVIDTATSSKTCLLPRVDYDRARTQAQAENEPQAAFAAFVLPAMLASSYTNNTTGETTTLECVRTPLAE